MVLVKDAADPGAEEISQDQLCRLRAVVALFPFPGHPCSSFSFVFSRSAAGCHGLDDRFSRQFPHPLGRGVPQRLRGSHRIRCVPYTHGLQLAADESGGIGWYLWLMIASIRRFMCQPPGTAARRVLLPYAVFTLLVNAGLTIATAALQAHEFDLPVSPTSDPFCSPANTLYRLMLSMPVVMNDALLVRPALIFRRGRCSPSVTGLPCGHAIRMAAAHPNRTHLHLFRPRRYAFPATYFAAYRS
jgi:hypothetical protein